MIANRSSFVALPVVFLALAPLACSGSDAASGPPGGTGGVFTGTGGLPAGTGGVPAGTGGVPAGTGGTVTGTGGTPVSAEWSAVSGPTMLTPANAVVTGTVLQCAGTTPDPLPQVTVAECVADMCTAAACVSGDLLTQFVTPETLVQLGNCDGNPNLYCVPIDYIATTGDFQTRTCTSLAGLEGRCVSSCVPEIADRYEILPQADCAPSERCAPCYDPTVKGPDGIARDTGACHTGCDTGPTQAPVSFVECGHGLALCVPQELIPEDLRAFVPVADCTQPGYVCAPKTNVADLDHLFTPCVPSSDLLAAVPGLDGPNGQKGACVPAFLVENTVPAPPEGAILQDTCEAGYLCAPCTNPLANQARTGACPPP